MSPRWKSMLGYDDSEIGVTPDEWLDRLHQDDWTRVRQTIAEPAANGKGETARLTPYSAATAFLMKTRWNPACSARSYSTQPRF